MHVPIIIILNFTIYLFIYLFKQSKYNGNTKENIRLTTGNKFHTHTPVTKLSP